MTPLSFPSTNASAFSRLGPSIPPAHLRAVLNPREKTTSSETVLRFLSNINNGYYQRLKWDSLEKINKYIVEIINPILTEFEHMKEEAKKSENFQIEKWDEDEFSLIQFIFSKIEPLDLEIDDVNTLSWKDLSIPTTATLIPLFPHKQIPSIISCIDPSLDLFLAIFKKYEQIMKAAQTTGTFLKESEELKHGYHVVLGHCNQLTSKITKTLDKLPNPS